MHQANSCPRGCLPAGISHTLCTLVPSGRLALGSITCIVRTRALGAAHPRRQHMHCAQSCPCGGSLLMRCHIISYHHAHPCLCGSSPSVVGAHSAHSCIHSDLTSAMPYLHVDSPVSHAFKISRVTCGSLSALSVHSARHCCRGTLPPAIANASCTLVPSWQLHSAASCASCTHSCLHGSPPSAIARESCTPVPSGLLALCSITCIVHTHALGAARPQR